VLVEQDLRNEAVYHEAIVALQPEIAEKFFAIEPFFAATLGI
jgi:hypothetical protein